jgi:hypothetical protein
MGFELSERLNWARRVWAGERACLGTGLENAVIIYSLKCYDSVYTSNLAFSWVFFGRWIRCYHEQVVNSRVFPCEARIRGSI